ncbi:Long-chain base-1-phosphate phosphatase [Coemansia furcata]|uniref:Long-chain base-1-phosphate phosphatase n=1 Tax=Coemansia furcata TaxID=417177 RepID=A0ACC1LKS4_9FUNG|nr:Long-chain base-1-phosphate phosphatase [Coemansia furcata]
MTSRFQLDEDIDAAVKSTLFVKAPESAYQAVYSPARQLLRRMVVEEVEREMPHLAAIQNKYRTPALDRLFVFTGMLGNHTFFLLALPFLHVFGLGLFARGLTFVVLWSVYLSGAAKDYISAPRPTSPPVAQITQSPAHTLEYGFPSSHTAYVVASIAYCSYFMLGVWDTHFVWPCALWTVGFLVVIGRIYCGLHSFIDVAGGAAIGLAEALAFIVFYERIDALLLSTAGPLYISTFVYTALIAIPPSLDQCPCCIDSVCATSVTLGLAIGAWIYARLPFLWHNGQCDRIAWDSSLTLVQNLLRCLIVIALIVAWKLASKPVMTHLAKQLVPVFAIATTPCCEGSDTASEVGYTKAAQDGRGFKDCDSAEVAAYIEKNYPIPAAECIKTGHYGTYATMASPENIARVPIYAGIGVIAGTVAPTAYYYLGLSPL